MPAPDLETLYDFEGQIEPACQARLVALGINQVGVQQGTGSQRSGRVDVELLMGAHRVGNYHVPANLPDGEIDTRACFEDSWEAMLVFTVVTNRDVSTQDHKAYRRKVRVLMLQFFSQFPEEALAYHEISFASTVGTVPGLMSDKDEDASKLSYKLVVSIRPDAWPAPY